MSLQEIVVKQYMTVSPHTIGVDQPMSEAHEFMRKNRVRHLPVLSGGKIVGIVSAGDLHLMETFDDVNPDKVLVEEAMTPEPYAVTPETPLSEVVQTMAEHKYGCAVVRQGNKVVGIFTTVDACRAFAEVLKSEGPSFRL